MHDVTMSSVDRLGKKPEHIHVGRLEMQKLGKSEETETAGTSFDHDGAANAGQNMKILPPVGRLYSLDWQHLLDTWRRPFLRPATIVISVAPMLANTPLVRGVLPPTFILTWLASLLVVAMWVTVLVACPRFLREYRDFGVYRSRQHSHRWILWEFYYTAPTLPKWSELLTEVRSKRLTQPIEGLPQLGEAAGKATDSSESGGMTIHRPVNVDRDLVCLLDFGDASEILVMAEGERLAVEKERELFWIIYSRAASARPRVRFVCWLLLVLAGLLFLSNVIVNVVRFWG